MYSECRPRLVAVQLLPPSSLRNAPAAEIAAPDPNDHEHPLTEEESVLAAETRAKWEAEQATRKRAAARARRRRANQRAGTCAERSTAENAIRPGRLAAGQRDARQQSACKQNLFHDVTPWNRRTLTVGHKCADIMATICQRHALRIGF